MENFYYLNNNGSRWVTYDKDGIKQRIVLETISGRLITRTVIFWESFGNYATACISYKGKKINVFTSTILED
jgi:hypothetical protein